MIDNKTCLPNGVGNPSTHQQAQKGDTVIDCTSDVFIHTYKITEEGGGRAFILRIAVGIKSTHLALEHFLQLRQRYILSKLAEEEFLVFGASLSHLTSEHTSIGEYFQQEQLSIYSSIEDAYCDLLEEWELRETVYR